jgi:osmotically-inducible protein OsmY
MTIMKSMTRLLVVVLLSTQLIGCAAVVVGGAVATGVAVHDRRSVGTVIDDNVLEVVVRDALYTDSAFDDNARIKINAFNGWVVLAGEVADDRLVDLATTRASEVDGVERLFNELAVAERASFGQASSDRWISSKVKASFTGLPDLPGFDPTRVQVTTARGIVYLQGLVTRDEANAVIEQARAVRGVERVITMFDLSMDEQS